MSVRRFGEALDDLVNTRVALAHVGETESVENCRVVGRFIDCLFENRDCFRIASEFKKRQVEQLPRLNMVGC